MRATLVLLVLLLAGPANAVDLGGTVEIKVRAVPPARVAPSPPTNPKVSAKGTLQLAAYRGPCASAESRAGAWRRYADKLGLIIPVAHEEGCAVAAVRVVPNNIPDVGEAWLVGLIVANNAMKYHGLGTSTTSPAESDTGCLAEVNSVYSTPNVRATGTLTTGVTTSQLLSAATTQLSATRTITEFCLLNQAAAPGGTAFTRTTFSGLVVTSSNFVDSTYRLTIE